MPGDLVLFVIATAALMGAVVLAVARRPDLVVDHPRSVLAAVCAVTLVAAGAVFQLDYPFFRIQLDPSSEALLPVADPARDVYRQAVLDFGSDDMYVIAMETDDVFQREQLEALRRISDEIRRLDGVTAAESVLDVHAYRYDPVEEMVEITRFIPEIPESADELAELRERALADPLYPRVIVSPDGRTAALNVSFRPMTDGEFVERDLDGRIQRILAAETAPNRHFFISGRPHIRAEAHHLMVRDLITLIPLAVVIANVSLFLISGSRRATLIPLVTCLTGTLWAYGALSLMGENLNVITIVLGPILICVGTVFGIHLIARYEQISQQAASSRQAAFETLLYVRLPVLLAGVTTCVGFGALLLADVHATNQLGGFCLFGIAAITMLALTAIPALLALTPLQHAAHDDRPLWDQRTRLAGVIGRLIQGALEKIGHLNVRYPGRVLLGWGAVTAVALWLIPQTVINTDFLMVFDEDHRVRTDFADVNRALVGSVPLYVILNGSEEGTFRDPAMLRKVEQMEAALRETPGVSHVLSAASLVKVANEVLQEGNPEEYRIPDTRPAVAEAVFTIPKEQLRRLANSNHSKANIVVRTGELGSSSMRALEARIRAVVARYDLNGVEADVTGNAILINRSADGIAGNQLAQVGFAALTILLLVTLAFRSLRLAVLSMIPNLVPVTLFFGALGAGAAELSLATALIGSIALGIAIDDSVHYLVAYHRLRGEGWEPERAALDCVLRVGRPIVITTIMIFVGFLSLLVSNFVTLREFGYLTSMTMAICLASDLTLMPSLLVHLRA